MELFDVFRKNARQGKDLTKKLNDKIKKGMSLNSIIDAFEEMCQIPIKGDEGMVLFETGTYKFSGEPLFYFCLARQFADGGEEYYQIHVDVQYKPTPENKEFHESVWNFDLGENIFDYIRKSASYDAVSKTDFVNVDIYMDRT